MESDLEELRAALAQLEARVRRLEGSRPEPTAPPPPPPTPAVESSANTASLIGRSLIAIGGAYLLRAATDLGWLPPWLGALCALVYAGVLLALADRAAARGASASALFHAGTAAAIANPLIDELWLRLHVVGAWSAVGIAAAFAAANCAVAHRRRHVGLAWIGILGAVAVYAALALQSQILAPCLAGLTFAVVAAGLLARRLDQRGLLALPLVAGSVMAPWLAELALAGDANPDVALAALLAFFLAGAGAIWWSSAVTHIEMVEAGLLAPAVLIESFRLAHTWFSAVLVAASAGGYIVARRSRFFRTYWLLVGLAAASLLAGSTTLTLLYLAVGVAVTLSGGDDFQVLAPLVAAAVASGLAGFVLRALALPSPLPPTLPALLVLAAALAAAAARPRVAALLIAGLALAGLLAWAGIAAFPGAAPVVRTAVLASMVMALALLSRLPRSAAAGKLVVPMLIVLGLKLVVEDFRVGTSATLFVDLALMGTVVIAAPRLRRSVREGRN